MGEVGWHERNPRGSLKPWTAGMALNTSATHGRSIGYEGRPVMQKTAFTTCRFFWQKNGSPCFSRTGGAKEKYRTRFNPPRPTCRPYQRSVGSSHWRAWIAVYNTITAA